MTLARGTPQLESERLVLRRITLADLDFFARIHADPIVARYLGHGQPRPADETVTWLQQVLDAYEQVQLGPLAVVRKSDGALLGRCGLNDLVVETKTAAGSVPRAWLGRSLTPADVEATFEPELGYTFDAGSWGHGYATEAARCVYRYARDVLNLPRIVSIIHPDNLRSRKLAEKLGARRQDAVELQSRVFDRYIWPH
jgi:ribosomal-protein-alanine N-acetyltransferase